MEKRDKRRRESGKGTCLTLLLTPVLGWGEVARTYTQTADGSLRAIIGHGR